MGKSNPHILVVDDEQDLRELLEISLLRMGFEVSTVANVRTAKTALAQQKFDLILTDMRMPDGTGLDLIAHLQKNEHDTPIAVITAYGNAESAVQALKLGAFDYISKPLQLEQLRTLVKSVLDAPQAAKKSLPALATHAFLGQSAAILHIRAMVEKLARSLAPVYITGESGSGKERAARMIHEQGARAHAPFIPVNCGAIPENLMESEFFGHKKGAFTGADQERNGFFQAANGGTLFLDEVADLPLAMQVKLLRAIQEKKVRKIGSAQEESIDVRIISATHQNLADCVTQGKFRQDLYYRLNVIELAMPSLREMADDIRLISQAILTRHCQAVGIKEPTLSPAAWQGLLSYDFPGNVRELENILERALALCDGNMIDLEDLRLTPSKQEASELDHSSKLPYYPLQDYLDNMERAAILDALSKTRNNRTNGAKLLGVTFRSMRYRIERLGIDVEKD